MKRALILLLLASVARAENNVEVPGVDVDLDAIYKTLDQVVVLAAKRPQTLREAPASTSIITAADLEAYGWRNFTEAIASLAGFYTNNPGDMTYFGVRGISPKSDTNGHILVLVDGHQQQELWSHAFYTEGAGLDASIIDHIEVLRGPASALYGSLGFLAIINVVTKRGTEKDWSKLTFEMTNASGFRGVASLGHRFKNDLEFGLSLNAWGSLGESYTYPDLADNSTCSPDIPKTCTHGKSDRATDADEGIALYGHMEFKGLSIKLSYQWWDKHIPFAPYRTLFNDHTNHYRLDRGYIDVGYTVGVPEKVQFSVRGYFDYAGYIDDLAYSDTGEPQDRYIFHDEAHPYWTGAEAKFLLEREWAQRLRFSFTLGGEFTYFHGDDKSGVVGDDPANWVNLSHNLIFGAAYAQAELAYARKLFLTFGLRGDFANFLIANDDFSRRYELSPRAGIVLLPYPSGTFKLLYSHGFVNPSWYDVFFSDGISILGNPKLGPERADNYEFVYQQEIGEPMLLTTSLFYIHGSDLIDEATVCVPDQTVTAPSPDCPAGMSARAQRQNLKSFQSLGTEIGLTGKFKRGIRMYANYSYAHATLGDGSRPFNSPEHLFKAGASIPVWRDHLVLGAELNVMSQRRLSSDSPDLSPPAALLNAFVMWKGLPKGLAVSFKVYNLTGITWYEPSTAEDSFPIVKIPHPGPTFALRLGYQF
jgi:iron complex outermembrane receptor protein